MAINFVPVFVVHSHNNGVSMFTVMIVALNARFCARFLILLIINDLLHAKHTN